MEAGRVPRPFLDLHLFGCVCSLDEAAPGRVVLTQIHRVAAEVLQAWCLDCPILGAEISGDPALRAGPLGAPVPLTSASSV